MIDLDAVIEDVRSAAEEVGAFVAEVVVSLEDAHVPVAGLDATAMAALIRHVRPRMVYCVAVPFDAGEYVLDGLFGDDADETLLKRPRVRKLVERWRHRDGQTAQVSATVMEGGVLHGLAMDATWLAEFEAEIEAHGEEAERLILERIRAAEAETKGKLGPMVKTLQADPRFAGPKVGNAKRLVLAEALFPDAERATLNAVVERAESEHWLATGR